MSVNNPKTLWEQSLLIIKENVSEESFNVWFRPIVFESYNDSDKTLLLQIPSQYFYEYLEEKFLDLLTKVFTRTFGKGVKLSYRIVTDKTNNIDQIVESEPVANIGNPALKRRGVNNSPTPIDAAPVQQIDSQLNPHHTFSNYIEGDSNKLPRSVGLSIAEHPNTTQFNPMFIYGPSGCGKTHLINAIGV